MNDIQESIIFVKTNTCMFSIFFFKFWKDFIQIHNKEWKGGEERGLDQVTVEEDFICTYVLIFTRRMCSCFILTIEN